MSASLSIKIGEVEIVCSGTEEFVKEQVPQLLAFADAQSKAAPVKTAKEKEEVSATANGTKLSASSIASKLGAASGPDLIMAACLRLARDGSNSFTRQQITDEMKSATSYFKASYVGNLTKYLGQLVKAGKLLEQAKDTFALPAKVRDEMEGKLA